MGIDVHWKDERGAVLGAVEDDGVLSSLSALLHRQTESICLRFIDPAGEACFNQQQRPILLDEFRRLLPTLGGRQRMQVDAIVQLIEGAVMTHTYVWFIGD